MRQLNKNGRHPVSFTLNGEPASGYAGPRMLLSDFLRQELGETGTHVGCEHGICGACTIRVEGKAVRSCLFLAVQAEGLEIETVEGLGGADGEPTPLQKAFQKHHALQCGYCTPGILASCVQFLAENSDPGEAAVRDMLSGHICRCTGYVGMVRAVLEVAAKRRSGK